MAASVRSNGMTASGRGLFFATMPAIQVHETGDESNLVLKPNVRIPDIAPSECLVENHYVGLNFHDTYTRSGLYPLKLPFVVGCEGGGVVTRVGSGVDGVKEGDRVVYLQEGEHGSYAQYTNVEHTRLMPVPDDVDLDLATAAAVQGLTAHYLVNDSYQVRRGDWCLVHAAAGGTGQLIVQMAKHRGANVIGTCSTRKKADIAKARGCDFVILTKSDDDKDDDDVWPTLAARVKRIVAERADGPLRKANYGSLPLNEGVHCAFDGVGKVSARASLESLRPRGTAVLFGNASGAPPDIPPLLLSQLGSLSVTRPKLHDFLRTREELVERSSAVFRMLQRGDIGVRIQEKVQFSQEGVVRATKMLHERKTVGKVLFDIRQGHISSRSAAAHIMNSRKASNANKMEKLGESFAPATVADGYWIQHYVKDEILKQRETTKVVGYKIGATSLMAQESVAVEEPFYGHLFSHSTFASPTTIRVCSDQESLGLQEQFMLIEPEFAVRMANDLDAKTDHTYDTIFPSIGSIFPSVEIATSAFAMGSLDNFKKIGAPSLVADNGCHGALVLGKEFSSAAMDPSLDEDSFSKILDGLDKHSCSLKVNGETVATGPGERVLGHPLNALCWLANELGKRGERLEKGDVITTGVVVDKLILAKVGDAMTVDYGDLLGAVTLNFKA